MGAKGYFNPRMKLKDFNKKRNAFVQKPDIKGMHKKSDSSQAGNKKRTWGKGGAKPKANS
jgi:hypothetical protein